MSHLWRLSARARVGLTLASVIAGCLLAYAILAWTASDTATASNQACAGLPAGGSVAATATHSGGNLDASRECRVTLDVDQSQEEAILAGASLIAFGGATLYYRGRRHRPHPG